MKRPLLSLALAAVLLAVLCRPAAALEDPFAPVRTYEGQFTDMAGDDWYYENVKALYELGLVEGQGEGLFAPGDHMTLAEAATLAARLRSLYEYGDSEAGPGRHVQEGTPWYQPYVAYLQALQVLGAELEGFERPATRAQMAHLLANALPQSLFTPLNADAVAVGYASRQYIRDVTDYTPYQREILLLYQWGILSGMDRQGAFLPEEPIERSQVAAMATRLVYEELRIQLGWDLSLVRSRAGATLEGLVESDGTFHQDPDPEDLAAMDENVRYMLSRGERRMVLRYGPGRLTEETVDALMAAALDTVRGYVEQSYNAVECTSSLSTGSVVLTFSSSLYEERMVDSYREATLEAAIAVHDALWADGTITASMSEYEKARVYFTWLCGNCVYDFESTDSSMSHSGYSAFVDGLAVCDGYTAAYNLLLKLEGIQCTTRSTPDHIWTVATLDGVQYHIDPTWGDQTGIIAYRYFAMTEAFSLARFT